MAKPFIALLLLLFLPAHAAPPITVDGLGWLQDRKQRESLEVLLKIQEDQPLNASTLEDAAMILFAGLQDEGFLYPEIEIEIDPSGRQAVGPSGSAESTAGPPDRPTARPKNTARPTFRLTPALDTPLPRPLSAQSAVLKIDKGRRFTLRNVTFDGLAVIPEEDARAYFRGGYALFGVGRERAYSPARLERSAANLREDLRRRGYTQAEVTAGEPQIDPRSGETDVRVTVDTGARWDVTEIEYAVAGGGPKPEFGAAPVGQPWSAPWRQDFESAVRRYYFKLGHPDVSVRLIPNPSIPIDGVETILVHADIDPGPAVTLGTVRFEGAERTRESVLRPLVKLHPGAPLDPTVLEDGQFAISHLGVFNAVELAQDPETGGVRDAVYHLREGRRSEASVLLGYGSYEQFRGGIELRHYNLWGLAHQDRLTAAQSVKSARGQYSYTIPQLFFSKVDLTGKLFGLRRHEPSFLRKEYGASASVAWPLPRLGLDVTAGYTFKRLFSEENASLAVGDIGRANSASLEFGVGRDRRDNPLSPRHGYKGFINVEQASRKLGGQVDYQRLQAGFSYHTNWGRTRWIHLGLTHGLVTTYGAPDDRELPVNVKFFPGGENSIRGFREGQATSRAIDGRFVGAKTMTLLNAELEQALFTRFSVILFSDTLGLATRLDRYPVDESLYTVGLGLRYQTLIGPLRLEYGRNLNPRPQDPSGTLLFSLGFPF